MRPYAHPGVTRPSRAPAAPEQPAKSRDRSAGRWQHRQRLRLCVPMPSPLAGDPWWACPQSTQLWLRFTQEAVTRLPPCTRPHNGPRERKVLPSHSFPFCKGDRQTAGQNNTCARGRPGWQAVCRARCKTWRGALVQEFQGGDSRPLNGERGPGRHDYRLLSDRIGSTP